MLKINIQPGPYVEPLKPFPDPPTLNNKQVAIYLPFLIAALPPRSPSIAFWWLCHQPAGRCQCSFICCYSKFVVAFS